MAIRGLTLKESELLNRMRQNRESWRAEDQEEFALAEEIIQKLLKLQKKGEIEAAAALLELMHGPPPEGEITRGRTIK